MLLWDGTNPLLAKNWEFQTLSLYIPFHFRFSIRFRLDLVEIIIAAALELATNKSVLHSFYSREFVREHEFVETKTMDTDETPQRQIPPPVLSGESISSEMEAIDLDTWEAIEDTRQFRWPKESPSLAVTVNFTAVCAGTAGADPTMIEDYDDESWVSYFPTR